MELLLLSMLVTLHTWFEVLAWVIGCAFSPLVTLRCGCVLASSAARSCVARYMKQVSD